MHDAGFLTVVSFAGATTVQVGGMDWGKDGFFDTIDNLRAAGLAVVGVGAEITAARAPVIVEAKGVRTAFLAYSSILPMNYWAEADRPGCAPMRAHTVYEQIEHDQPGTPARVHTYAHRQDLAALTADIAKARALADVVVVSLHWGIHFVPAVLADYQHEVAHAAIDAGADLILGHHAHIMKGVEVYKGKTILLFAEQLRRRPADDAGARGVEGVQGDPGPGPRLGAGLRQPLQLPARRADDPGRPGDLDQDRGARCRLPAGLHQSRGPAGDRRRGRSALWSDRRLCRLVLGQIRGWPRWLRDPRMAMSCAWCEADA